MRGVRDARAARTRRRTRTDGVGAGWLTVRVARARETTPATDPPTDPVTDPAAGGPDPATLGYEQARDELATIVARLEAGAGTLEESLALWERGEALAARCQQWLDGARERLTAARASRTEAPDDAAGTVDEEDAR